MELGQISQEHTKIAELSRRIGEILVERGDYEQAMHQFQLGLQYLEGIEHKEVVRIYNEIGRVYWSQGKLQEAQEWTEKAFALAARLLDPDELARLLYHAGIRYHRQGSNKLAEDHWLRSLEISEETGDLVMQARLYQNLGWQSETLGDYALALERLEKGRQLAEQCSDISSLSFIYETLGETYFILGDWDRAIESFQQSLNLAEQAGLRKATSRVFSVLGDIYRIQGRWAQADECYQRALSAITTTGTPQSLFVVNLSLALINMERERYAKAREHFEKCWSITSYGVGFASRMALAKAYMAELAIRTGDIAEAEKHAGEAISLAEQADFRKELAHGWMVKGMVATEQGHWGEAEKLLKDAERTFRELGARYHLGRTLSATGAMYLRRDGGPQDRERARRYIADARQILEELHAQTELDRLPDV